MERVTHAASRLTVASDTKAETAKSPGTNPAIEPTSRTAYRWLTLGLLVTDAACILGAMLLVGTEGAATTEPWERLLVLFLAAASWVAIFHAFHLYSGDRLPPWEEFRGIIAATSVGVVVIVGVGYWSTPSLSRTGLGLVWVLALVFELIARRLFRWYVRHAKRAGHLTLRTLVVGTHAEGQRIGHALDAPVRGFTPIGCVTSSDLGATDGLPVLGDLSDLDRVILDNRVECVFVASSEVSAAQLSRISRVCRLTDAQIWVSANLPEMLMSRFTVHNVDEITAFSIRPVRLTGTSSFLKRLVDLLLGALALVVAMPFLVLIGLMVRLTSRGPVLFRQQRVTKDGRVFTMLKFRTMVADPERALQGKLIDLSQPFFKLTDDPRLTKVGRVLRALSLDELPQLWNVVKGDMSLVGPRPLPLEQVRAHPELLAPRHEVRAGMTGWWQVHGRSDVDVEGALKLDTFYIENWSLALDAYIILKTLGAIIARRGAR